MIISPIKPRSKRRSNLGIIFLIILWIFMTSVIAWPLYSGVISPKPKTKLPQSDGFNYLVIAPQGLEQTAATWGKFREEAGYKTKVEILSDEQVNTDQIRDLIQQIYTESGKPYPFYVLLIGAAHPGSSYPDSYLPAATFSIDPTQFFYYGEDPIASDDGFVGDYISAIPRNTLPIFIGRIPARTEEEGMLLLERTQVYETNPPSGEGRGRIELITSDPDFGPQYESVLAWMLKTLIQKLAPDEYTWHILNGNSNSPYNYPSTMFSKEFANRLDSGALAMIYVGHGQPEFIAWTYAQDGTASRIFGFEDAELIKNAHGSLGIFTACSAGDYDLTGDNISVVESVYLTPGGPAATYSSSAFINAKLNGRLVLDLSEALLIDQPATMGEWVGQIEAPANQIPGHKFLSAMVKAVVPRISGLEKYSLISSEKAEQVMDIQHATYNLFGDPALKITYPQLDMEVHHLWVWHPWKGKLAFTGKSSLPEGTKVNVTLERIPGDPGTEISRMIEITERYEQANNTVIAAADVTTEKNGGFSGRITIPDDTPGGKYILRAVAIKKSTYISAHIVYTGFPPVIEILSSVTFWWAAIGLLLAWKLIKSIFVIRQSG